MSRAKGHGPQSGQRLDSGGMAGSRGRLCGTFAEGKNGPSCLETESETRSALPVVLLASSHNLPVVFL